MRGRLRVFQLAKIIDADPKRLADYLGKKDEKISSYMSPVQNNSFIFLKATSPPTAKLSVAVKERLSVVQSEQAKVILGVKVAIRFFIF